MKRKAKKKRKATVSSTTGAKHPGGRPTKFTPEVREKILQAIRASSPLETAAQFAGIVYDTLNNWHKRAEKEKVGEYSEFFKDVKKARAESDVRHVANIVKAAQGGALISERTTQKKDGSVETVRTYARPEWTASAWILERSDPSKWAKPERIELTGAEGRPVRTEVTQKVDLYDPNRLARLIGAFGEADIIPEEVLARFSAENVASAKTH